MTTRAPAVLKMTGSPGQTRPLILDLKLRKDLQVDIFQIPVGNWWHWVSRGHLVLGGTGSVLDGTDWYLILLGR